MMGYSHSLSAAAVWLALHETGMLHSPDIPTLTVTVLACAGAGMLPDIDHRNASIAGSLPPISTWVTAMVSTISGGHRKGTHSLLGVAFFWCVAIGAEQLTYRHIPWASILLAAYTGGLALRMFGAPGGWMGAVALAYFAWTTDSLHLLPTAIGVGATVHIIGDALTVRGVNPLWPLVLKPAVASPLWRKSGYMALPVLGEAGSTREHLLGAATVIYLGWSVLVILGYTELSPTKALTALIEAVTGSNLI